MKARYILIASVLVIIAGLYQAGQNANQAGSLANQVVTLDATDQPTTAALATLAAYSAHHMGASSSVYLAGAYGRAQTAAGGNTSTGQVYHDAQAACVSRTSAVNQANCVQAYVASHATPGSASITTPTIDKSKFTYSYQAPRWTPDMAGGWLLAGVLGLITAVVFGLAKRRL